MKNKCVNPCHPWATKHYLLIFNNKLCFVFLIRLNMTLILTFCVPLKNSIYISLNVFKTFTFYLRYQNSSLLLILQRNVHVVVSGYQLFYD